MAITGGLSSAYTYYADGSLNTLTWSSVAQPFKYTYRLNGQYDVVTFPNGQTRAHSYDDQGRLLQLANALGSTNLATYAYGYDVNNTNGTTTMLGQRTSLTASVPSQGLSSALSKYYYDPLYQLTRADYPSASPFNSEVDSWTYDDIGNRLTNTVNGVPATYTYLKNGSNPLNGQRLSNDGTNAYTWDNNGSDLTRNGTPGSFTFGYSVDNRLSSISGAATATYTYDYQGRRTSKTVGSTTTTYLYDGLNLVTETTGGNPVNYAFGPGVDEPLATYQSGTLGYMSPDALGTVSIVSNAAGTVQNSYVFDAWGASRASTSALTNSFGYTAREFGEGVLLGYRARYLQPGVGRFTQEDPIGFRGGVNFYRYVANRPAELIDPHGVAAEDPPPPKCTSCNPNEPLIYAGLKKVCQAAQSGECAATLRKYGLDGCFGKACKKPLPVVCIPKAGSCNGCGGPCNVMSDTTSQIFLQADAFEPICGSLANTIAHEMAHMCGIGIDNCGNAKCEENKLKANNVGVACGGK